MQIHIWKGLTILKSLHPSLCMYCLYNVESASTITQDVKLRATGKIK
jgi:hypothetical protein